MDVLEGLYGLRPLRVAIGATIPIGGGFRRKLEAVFFSFSTADEDYHGPNEFFRLHSFRTGLVAWAQVLEAIGALASPLADGVLRALGRFAHQTCLFGVRIHCDWRPNRSRLAQSKPARCS